MLGRTVGILAASALGASAFLIPTGLVHEQAAELIAPPGGLNSKQSIVSLPCSECAFSPKQKEDVEDVKDIEGAEEEFWIQGGANSVLVNLTISEDGKRLEINGEPIYPLEFQLESLMGQRIYVSQVASSASIKDIEAGNVKATPLEVTGSGVSIHEEEVVSPEGHMIIPIKHTIFELERQPVSLDEIFIKLLKTAEGELFIAHISTEQHHPPRPAHFFEDHEDDVLSIMPHQHKEGKEGKEGHHRGPPGHGGEKECRNLPATLCKLKHIIEEKFMGMRQGHGHGRKGGPRKGGKKGGCHGGPKHNETGRPHHGPKHNKTGRPHDGKLPSHIRPHFLRIGQDGEDAPHHMRPHSHHDGPRHHGHHRHGFMHSFSRGLSAVLIPTMLGVAVGMVVSLFGLCVGRMISYLWIKLYRGGRRGYKSVRLEEEDVVAESDMEKKSFIVLEQSEPLPIYEEAPSYEETQQEQK